MAYWNDTLDIKDEWSQAKDGEITTGQLAHIVAEKLAHLYWFRVPPGLAPLIREFQEMPEDVSDDDFDIVWDHLYDWADDGHRLWIKTF